MIFFLFFSFEIGYPFGFVCGLKLLPDATAYAPCIPSTEPTALLQEDAPATGGSARARGRGGGNSRVELNLARANDIGETVNI